MPFILLQTPPGPPSKAPSDSVVIQKLTEKVDSLSTLKPEQAFKVITDDLLKFGLKVLAALAIYFVGAWLIKRLKKFLEKIFEKRATDKSLAGFVGSLVTFVLTVLLIAVIISVLGVDTTSFAALLASLGLAIGMAMSGTLQNFAGGVMILTFKPFKVGDYIDTQGYTGFVNKIEITQTTLITFDNKDIILPNGTLSNGNIRNYSKTDLIRCEWTVAISYGDDFEKASKCIVGLLESKEWIIRKPVSREDPYVLISELGDNGVILKVRCWMKLADYWNQMYFFYEDLYRELPKAGISFPFPQIQIHKDKE
jgi:small conductance mechanosensitive channel